MADDAQGLGFVPDPDKTNEENCLKLASALYAKADDIGRVDQDGFDGDSLANSIMDATAATAEDFDRGTAQDRTITIIGDQGSGKSTFINLLMLNTEVDESQYGLVPAYGLPMDGSSDAPPTTRSRAQRTPSQSEWEDTICAIPYLRQVVSKSQLKMSTSANASVKSPLKAEKERRSKEFQLKVDKSVSEAVASAIRPPFKDKAILKKHMSENYMKTEELRLQRALRTCDVFPENNSNGVDELYEHLLKAANEGDATSFTQTRIMWGPTFCALIRTKTVEELIASMKAYPFETNLQLLRQKKISEKRSKAAYDLLVDMCAKLRVLAGEDRDKVEKDTTIDAAKLPSFTNIKICDEIRQKAGKNVIIAGNGIHQAHDRVFVREELQKFLTPSIGIIVEEVVVFQPSLLLKKGLIIIDTPGTMDTNPFRRAATRDAVQQADMLVALSSKASLQIGSWIDVLREADFWKRMLQNPTTCKIMLLSSMDEKGRRLTAAKVHEQWEDTSKPLCKAREKLPDNPELFKDMLKKEYDALTATEYDSEEEDMALDETQALELEPFENIWRKIEPGVQSRNVVCMPLLYTSLSLYKGKVAQLDEGQRARVLEMTGGDQMLMQMLEMVDDKSKGRMEDLLQKLKMHTTDSATGTQHSLQPLPAEFAPIFKREGGKKWTGVRDKDERLSLIGGCKIKMDKVLSEAGNHLDKVDAEITLAGREKRAFDQHLEVVENDIKTWLNDMPPSKVVKALTKETFVPKSSRTGALFNKLFGGMQEQSVLLITGECAEKTREVFRHEITEMLIEKIIEKLDSGRTRRQAAESDGRHKETIRTLVTEWCDTEISSPGTFLKAGDRKLQNFSAKELTELKTACYSDAAQSMLDAAKDYIDSQPQPKGNAEWRKLRSNLVSLVTSHVQAVVKKAYAQFAQQVCDIYWNSVKELKGYYDQPDRLRKERRSGIVGVTRFLSVYGACYRKLALQCAISADQEENIEELQRRDALTSLIDVFDDALKEIFDQDVESSAQVLTGEIKRQQLLRWIRQNLGGPLSLIERKKNPKRIPAAIMKVFDTEELRPLKHFTDEERFKQAVDTIRDDKFEPNGNVNTRLLKAYHPSLSVYDEPHLLADSDSLFRAMIHAITDIDEDSDWEALVKSMRNTLVHNTLAQYSSSRSSAVTFKELNGGEETLEKWGERMLEGGEGDVFILESFCKFYKVNAYLLTPLQPPNEKRVLSFPAFRAHGATYAANMPCVFVRFPRGVFGLVTTRVGGTAEDDKPSVRTVAYDMEEEEREVKKRCIDGIMQKVDKEARAAGLSRSSKRARTSSGASSNGASSAGGSPAGGSRGGRRSHASTTPSMSPAYASSTSNRVRHDCPPGWKRVTSKTRGEDYFLNPSVPAEKLNRANPTHTMWEYQLKRSGQ